MISEARFWPRVDRGAGPTACWPWMGTLDRQGYGRVGLGERHLAAHRVAYSLAFGNPPAGLTLDHLCRNRRCVNPAHLEPVSRAENVLRGVGITARHARATHCTNGHEYTPENTRPRVNRNGRTTRKCRTCEAKWTETGNANRARSRQGSHSTGKRAIGERAMTREVDGGIVIEQEKPQQCDLCGVIAELRPYGPNGEAICFDCGMKNRETTDRAYHARIADIDTVFVAESE